MSSYKPNTCPKLRFALLVFLSSILLLSAQGARAQSLMQASSDEKKPAKASSTPDSNVDARVRALEEALEKQNSKLEQMQKIITGQQQTIERLSANPSTLQAASVVSSIPTTDAVPNSNSATASNAPSANSSSTQTQTIEERLKKVEGQVLKFGPFRLSGDFRLRADGIFRSASETPGAPLQHVQNVRARYRLRLNFDTDIYPTLSFHGQLATGPINNALTLDQDFSSTVARHPFFINEAWVDYHPNKNIQLQAGRVQEVFADNSRFLFDDDVRFNGFNEKYSIPFKANALDVTSVELRAGQYILSNPNVAVVTAGSPLALAGATIGSTGRASNLFHQGLLVNQQFNKKWGDQLGADIQLYRNPNQIQLASTAAGVVLIVQPGIGLTLSGPLTGTGNATTTPGGAIYTARNFQIARFTYRLSYAGFKYGERNYPVTFSFQGARNVGISLKERDAMLAALQVGKVAKRGDTSYLYVFSIKGANSLISQLTDDDLGTGTGVNLRTHHLRFDYGLAKKVTLQSLFFIQRQLRNSGQYPNFFVPLGAFAPRTYRFQEQIVFTF
ncbi:MAG: putative porin [Pyrinomonadaceae bacterium]